MGHEHGRASTGKQMNRLHEKGLISDARGKAKSIVFTENGLKQAEHLLGKLFSKVTTGGARQPSAHVYAIVRLDGPVESSDDCVYVKEIVSTQAIAEAEVQRLNELNADKHCKYFWQITRLFPENRSAGKRKGEYVHSCLHRITLSTATHPVESGDSCIQRHGTDGA